VPLDGRVLDVDGLVTEEQQRVGCLAERVVGGCPIPLIWIS
jgi:hypothetical protein